MKSFGFIIALVGIFFTTNTCWAEETSEAVLQSMSHASRSLNYELSYINITKQGIDSLRYRYSLSKNQPLAQLLQMDGSRREVILRGSEISYFESGVEPFTLKGDHIVDALPSIVFADINQLRQYYNFISVGRTRVADRSCQVVRIVAQDGLRFSYIVWIDEHTRLPLRIDLLDRDGETLEQFRVISFTVGDLVKREIMSLSQVTLPPLLSLPAMEHPGLSWHVGWIPEGFKEISHSRRALPSFAEPVESRLFSDGLFSFSVNLSNVNGATTMHGQALRQGRRTIYTESYNDVEIIVIGELPPNTAKRVAASISLESVLPE